MFKKTLRERYSSRIDLAYDSAKHIISGKFYPVKPVESINIEFTMSPTGELIV